MTDIQAFLCDVLKPLTRGTEPHPVRVTLTFAQSVDAKIAGRDGKQLILSCHESMVMTHRLRSMHDAILVGIGTALNDNPQLNTRLLPPEDGNQNAPLPIILDSNLAFQLDCKLVDNFKSQRGRQPTIFTKEVKTGEDKEWLARRIALEAEGLRVISVPSDEGGKLQLPSLLTYLSEMGIRTLMVEGGARVIDSFMRSGLVKHLIVTISPCFVGPDGIGYEGHDKDAQFVHQNTRLVGRDAVTAWRRK